MEKWQPRKTTTPHKATQLELPLPLNNVSTDDETEEQLRLLIGAILSLTSYTVQFAQSLEQVALSNLGTPKTEAVLSFALLEMVSLTMSMLDQAKAYRHTLKASGQTLPSDDVFMSFELTVSGVAQELIEQFDL